MSQGRPTAQHLDVTQKETSQSGATIPFGEVGDERIDNGYGSSDRAMSPIIPREDD